MTQADNVNTTTHWLSLLATRRQDLAFQPILSLGDPNYLTSMIVGRWCASPRTSIWCPHDQVLAESRTAMPQVGPA